MLCINIQGCSKDFKVTIISKEDRTNTAINPSSNYNSYVHTKVQKGRDILISSAYNINLEKIKWRNTTNWAINSIQFQDSHQGGVHIYHSPTLITCYEVNNHLNFILEIDVQIATQSSKLTEIPNKALVYPKIQNGIKKLQLTEVDTVKLTGIGSKIENGIHVKMKKIIHFQNQRNGLVIKEIESYSQKDVQGLQTIFGPDTFLIIDEKNLPSLLKY